MRLEIIDTRAIPKLRAGMSVIVEIDTGFKRQLPAFVSEALTWVND